MTRSVAVICIALCLWLPFANTQNIGTGSFQQAINGAISCIRTGEGPGNSVICGSRSTQCLTTGSGPGNKVECGDLATHCERTGMGPGNDAACGGMAVQCENGQ